jgi:heme/copper-type cytochrome/quinol oxidase subunit 2
VSRTRVIVVAALLVVFFVAGGIVIYATSHHGGQNRTFDVTVTDASKMTPDTLTANQNDMVTINIHSDSTGEVHLHEYDIAFDTVAGQVVSHTFKADKTGQHDIEWESTSVHLGYLIVNP